MHPGKFLMRMDTHVYRTNTNQDQSKYNNCTLNALSSIVHIHVSTTGYVWEREGEYMLPCCNRSASRPSFRNLEIVVERDVVYILIIERLSKQAWTDTSLTQRSIW